jgi:hypothetical protein
MLMKKRILSLIIVLVYNNIQAQENHLTTKEPVIKQHILDEYEEQFNNDNIDEDEYFAEQAMQEYEQYICDNVKPPKPSAITAMLTHIGCTLLVHYIAVTEKAKICLANIKSSLAKWLCKNS